MITVSVFEAQELQATVSTFATSAHPFGLVKFGGVELYFMGNAGPAQAEAIAKAINSALAKPATATNAGEAHAPADLDG
jgi:hypothetical protein